MDTYTSQYEPVTINRSFFVFLYTPYEYDSNQHFPKRYETGTPVGLEIYRLISSHFRQADDEPNM